jgi:phosphoribosyl 1,2-cyclic phosphodiesterase
LKLVFLGTRGEIEHRSAAHGRHSALLVRRGRARVMIDCGLDWLGEVEALQPDAVVLTHAHPDHAAGLRLGAPCPVYGTAETLQALRRYPIEAVSVRPRMPLRLHGLRLEAFPVAHSLRAPAVGYRVSEGQTSFFYVPDVVSISDPREALRRLRLYVGDGASLRRPIVRRRGEALIGHASVRDQLGWCAAARVPWAVFTHCGSQLVRRDLATVTAAVEELGQECGVRAEVAVDGLELDLS